MLSSMKAIYWAGRSLDDLKGFPLDAKQEAGFQLDRVQRGLDPNNWKPIKMVGPGVREIRIKVDPNDQYRVLYVAEIEGRLLVLHAFQKKSQRTAKSDIDLARARLSGALKELRK